MDLSIGVFAYNEEGSIGELLDALIGQDLQDLCLSEVIVVSFGSIDATNQIVIKKAELHRCIRLESYPVCLGKAASVTRFLELAASELCVLVSADAALHSPHAVYRLLQPLLHDPEVGIVGARHRISNPGAGFVAFAGERVWSTLHLVSLLEPKISGDLMAIRAGVVPSVPSGILNDDAFLELACRQHGLQRRYCPDAEVFIRIPENLREYLSQRRRIYGGHRQLARYFPEYRLSTTRFCLLVGLLFRQVTSVRSCIYTVLLMLLDAAVRAQAQVDNLARRYEGGRWPTIFTTKLKLRQSTDGAG